MLELIVRLMVRLPPNKIRTSLFVVVPALATAYCRSGENYDEN